MRTALILNTGVQVTQALASGKLRIVERKLEEIFQEAVQLPARDRAILVSLLIETLDPISEPDVEAAWSAEIDRRLTEVEAGTVKLIRWEEVRAELLGESE